LQNGCADGPFGSFINTGGAILNHNILSLTDVTLSQNSALFGGAIFNNTSGTMQVSSSTLSDNLAGFNAGGIDNFGTITFLTNTNFFK